MIITLLTDYGLEDDFVGVCHGVIRSISPDAQIVDLTHGIPRYDVRAGALVLRRALPYTPVGVHVAVVDPQVGGARRGVALGCGDGRLLVGPDNGLLSPLGRWSSYGPRGAVRRRAILLTRQPSVKRRSAREAADRPRRRGGRVQLVE